MGGGVLPGSEPPCSLTPGLISDKQKVIFHAFFQSWPPGRNYVKEFANISFSFLFFNLELKRQIRAYTTFFSLENHSQFQTKMSKVYIRF